METPQVLRGQREARWPCGPRHSETLALLGWWLSGTLMAPSGGSGACPQGFACCQRLPTGSCTCWERRWRPLVSSRCPLPPPQDVRMLGALTACCPAHERLWRHVMVCVCEAKPLVSRLPEPGPCDAGARGSGCRALCEPGREPRGGSVSTVQFPPDPACQRPRWRSGKAGGAVFIQAA